MLPPPRRIILLELYLFYWRFYQHNSDMVGHAIMRPWQLVGLVAPDVKSMEAGEPPPSTWGPDEWQQAFAGIVFWLSIPLSAQRVYVHFRNLGLEAMYALEMYLMIIVFMGDAPHLPRPRHAEHPISGVSGG